LRNFYVQQSSVISGYVCSAVGDEFCFYSKDHGTASWKVDLGRCFTISRVVIQAGPNVTSIVDTEIRIGMDHRVTRNPVVHTITASTGSYAFYDITLTTPASGQYLGMTHSPSLVLCEVMAYE